MGFLARTLINAFALWAATEMVSGIHVAGFGTLLVAAVIFGVVNAVIRPVAMVLAFPLRLLTLGLFTLVVNALMLGLTAWLMLGFSVDGFWPALWGAVIVSIMSWAVSHLFRDRAEGDRPGPA